MKSVSILEFAKFIGLCAMREGFKISPLKLQKVLYYQQAWHMVFFGRENTLFSEAPQAWVNGPVYPAVYNQYKNCVPNICANLEPKHFLSDGEESESVLIHLSQTMGLKKEELDLAQQVLMLYGSRTQNQLIFLTHSEMPWAEQRIGLMPFEYSENAISLDTMFKYYKARYDKNRAQ